eukprot:31035-Chlamydomonas_euryale.AAC.1
MATAPAPTALQRAPPSSRAPRPTPVRARALGSAARLRFLRGEGETGGRGGKLPYRTGVVACCAWLSQPPFGGREEGSCKASCVTARNALQSHTLHL